MTPYYIYKQKVLKKGKGKIKRGYQKNKEDIIKEEEKEKMIKH